jgi:hypothetical protein
MRALLQPIVLVAAIALATAPASAEQFSGRAVVLYPAELDISAGAKIHLWLAADEIKGGRMDISSAAAPAGPGKIEVSFRFSDRGIDDHSYVWLHAELIVDGQSYIPVFAQTVNHLTFKKLLEFTVVAQKKAETERNAILSDEEAADLGYLPDTPYGWCYCPNPDLGRE